VGLVGSPSIRGAPDDRDSGSKIDSSGSLAIITPLGLLTIQVNSKVSAIGNSLIFRRFDILRKATDGDSVGSSL